MKELIDGILKRYMAADYFPGVVCKVIKEESTIYERAFGYARVKPEPRPVALDTVFDIASLTKIVTATMILILVTEGRLTLEDTVLQHIPEASDYSSLKDRLMAVTLKDLLTHHSGLIAWYPFYSEAGDFLKVMDKISRNSVKVEGVMYSDLNFMLLGKIVERITGKSLDKALKDLIAEPLDIKSISYCPKDYNNIAFTEYGNRIEQRMCSDRSIVYNGWRDTDKPICGEANDGNAFYFFKGIAGHAGIFSDIDGLIKISQLYLKGGEWRGKKLIDSKLVGEAIKEQRQGRGLGWQISPVFPEGCGHSGFTGTSIWLYPAKKAAVVTLTNRLHTESPKTLDIFRRELHESILKKMK